jgi:hypothetical protein
VPFSPTCRMIVAPSFRAGASSSRSICWSGSKPLLVDHIACLREAVATTRADATGGLRCLDALAADQKPFCQSAAKTGSTQCRSQSARGERGIWQRRFWEHLIREDADDARHVEYCHINPLKHAWSNAGATGRSHRFIATWARECFRSIGAAISKRSASLVSGGIGEANFMRGIAAWKGGLRLRLNPP